MRDLGLGEESGDISHGQDSYVASVSLESFRNYESLAIGLSPHFNVLVGPNGQGKTNFLESLYLLSTTRLLRGQKDSEAIRDGNERTQVAAELLPSETRLGITIEHGIRKRASLNGLGLPRASDILGRLPCVSISSADMSIVRGEPSDRRLFLDLELSSLYPAYLRHLTHYKRALEQRNAILKNARERYQPAELYEPWELHLAQHGSALRALRFEYVCRLAPRMVALHQLLGSGEAVAMEYGAKDDNQTAEDLAISLEHSRGTDVIRGSTTIGPHRDDLLITVLGRDARLYGSQGQQRTAVISLKMASLEVAHRELMVSPLLLLDDIFSDLDETRRALLVDVVLDNAGQVVLTCTESASAGPKVLERASLFAVRSGRIASL